MQTHLFLVAPATLALTVELLEQLELTTNENAGRFSSSRLATIESSKNGSEELTQIESTTLQ